MKSDIFYFDDEDKMVDKEKATHAIVREYDDNGNLVHETFVKFNQVENSNELSEEDLKLIAEFDEKYGSSLKI